jgi:catechol 2,3-dioxygenase-like lactoylglutathione lyase family enzyme
MRAFAELLDRLSLTPSRNAKLTLVRDYLRAAPDPDRGYALGALTGDLTFSAAKPAMIRAAVERRMDPVLFGWSYNYVGDLAEAAAFYHDALGFDKVVWGYPGALFLSAGGYHHHLGTNTWAAGAPPAGEDDARLLEWEMVLPDAASAAAAAESVERAGGAVERSADGSIVAHDPWGTAVRLVSVI